MQLPARNGRNPRPLSLRAQGPAVKSASAWHRMILGPLVLAVILAAVGATGWAKPDAELAVSARVLPRTTLQVRSAPLDLVISSRDVRQAYVDVNEPTRVQVSNNRSQGYVLLVTQNMPGFTALMVQGAGVEATLGGKGGEIPERGRVGLHLSFALRYRFLLGPHIEPGRYPWPVQLTVRPLAQ